MAVVAQLAAATGTPIVGTALAARTAVGLQEATGIASSSLASLNLVATVRDGLPRWVVVVVDEASMVGTRQLASLSDQVSDAGGKLILIGDPHQLPEIEAGGLFQTLVDRLAPIELHQNVRQEQGWERAALDELRTGSVAEALATYRKQERLVIEKSRDETLARAVGDWHQHVTATGDLSGALLLAQDNWTVRQLNELARDRLADSGQLTGPTFEADGREYHRGSRVICLKNDPRIGALNGDLATVTSVNSGASALTVQLDRESDPRVVPDWYLDEGRLDHGYAMSGHKAQGITVDATFSVIGDAVTREWAYVAMSRGRKSNSAYLLTPEEYEQCTHLKHEGRDNSFEGAVARTGRRERKGAAIERDRDRDFGLDFGL